VNEKAREFDDPSPTERRFSIAYPPPESLRHSSTMLMSSSASSGTSRCGTRYPTRCHPSVPIRRGLKATHFPSPTTPCGTSPERQARLRPHHELSTCSRLLRYRRHRTPPINYRDKKFRHTLTRTREELEKSPQARPRVACA
jgi:hypothetical protein